MHSSNKPSGVKKFVYYSRDDRDKKDDTESNDKGGLEISNDILNKLLKLAGREAIREKTPSLSDLEQTLEQFLSQQIQQKEKNVQKEYQYRQQIERQNLSSDSKSKTDIDQNSFPIVTHLIEKGYLKDSQKWLSKKGFLTIGNRILDDIMKALKTGEFGIHETTSFGTGSIVIDTTKKYEPGDDIHLVNVSKSLLNAVQRIAKDQNQKIIRNDKSIRKDVADKRGLNVPLELDVEDLEEYETMEDVRVAVVYCIDLSSTMRYTSMFGDMSRIEAAKRALWSLYLLNKKFFPSDSIYVVGFGALASKVAPMDIPYLKTFEPGGDFLHYTNYQAAFRLASKILQKDGAMNKRIVLVTDGHPSACFIDDKKEQEKILSQRPYSHFYTPDRTTLDNVKENQDMSLDVTSGNLVYLCYRYRQVDQYIGERTIVEAKKCRRMGIEIDTVMISEEDSLLGYVNEMERYVRGRSYYINPSDIDKILLTDYLSKRKLTIRAAGV